MSSDSNSIVSLNVGGTIFQTRPETLLKYENSKLAKMYEEGKKIKNTNFFLDQNPDYFKVILDFLRNGKVMELEDLNFFNGVLDVAKNLDLTDLVDILEKQEIHSMVTLKFYRQEVNGINRNVNVFTDVFRISRIQLTSSPESNLAKYFSGQGGSQNPVSEFIYKETQNSNIYVVRGYTSYRDFFEKFGTIPYSRRY